MSFNFENEFTNSMEKNRNKIIRAKEKLKVSQTEERALFIRNINKLITETLYQFITWSKNGTLFKTRHIPRYLTIKKFEEETIIKCPDLICTNDNTIKIEFIFRDQVTKDQMNKNQDNKDQRLKSLIKDYAVGYLAFTDEANVSMGFDIIESNNQRQFIFSEHDSFQEQPFPVTSDALGKLLIYLLTKVSLDKFDDQAIKTKRNRSKKEKSKITNLDIHL